MTDEQLKKEALALAPWLTKTRRDLHKIPEPGFEEFETQAYIMRALEEMKIPYTTHKTWVVGLISGARPGRTVALRADMDGLPLKEPAGCGFASTHPGYMHACGHDAHVTMALGAARLLNAHKDELAGNVKLLFQPAEETVGGALPMVQAGVLENPHVDKVFGLHVMSRLPLGTVETRYGALNGSSDDVQLFIRGKAGHGAYPEMGVDGIVIAAQVICALQTLVSRNVSPLDSAVLSFGTIEGGSANNVLCGEVKLHGTLRTISPKTRETLLRRMEQISTGIARSMGGDAELVVEPGYCALINHDADVRHILNTATRLLGKGNVLQKPEPSMGVEDFSYFIEHTPGAFFHLGCAVPGESEAAPLHSVDFTLDERCLPIGVMMHAALVMEALAEIGEEEQA